MRDTETANAEEEEFQQKPKYVTPQLKILTVDSTAADTSADFGTDPGDTGS